MDKIKYCPFSCSYVPIQGDCVDCTMCGDILLIFIDDCLTKQEVEKLDEHLSKSLQKRRCVCLANGFNNSAEEIATMNGYDFMSLARNDYLGLIKIAIKHKKPVLIATSLEKAKDFQKQVQDYVKEEQNKVGKDSFEVSKIVYKVYDDVLENIENREDLLNKRTKNEWLTNCIARNRHKNEDSELLKKITLNVV